MLKPYKSTMIRLREQDMQAVRKIREYFAIHSDNQAIVTAIRLVSRQVEELPFAWSKHWPITDECVEVLEGEVT